MNPQKTVKKPILCLCLALLLLLPLAACGKQAEEQDSTPPTASVQPTPTPEPTPTPPPIPYTDVAEDAPYYDAVVWAYENGIASDGNTFEPLSTCTRGQVITFLWRAMGSPEPWIMENPFSDASPDAWYYKPALWAYQHNVATSATVDPGKPCTSAEALTFLWRAEGRPMAAMHNSFIALAAPNQYFTRPVAWAETNGLLSAEVGFNPSANCLRAEFMTYLCWATEEWTFTEEDKTVQAEYEQILYSSQNHAGYADYIDVDGDGKEELLTLEYGYEGHNMAVTVTVYANINGHVVKSCEGVFRVVGEWGSTPADTFLTDDGLFSLYSSDGQLYLCQNRSFYMYGRYDDLYDFYKIGKEAVTFYEQRSIWTLIDRETGEETKGDTGTSRSYTKQKDIFLFDNMGPQVLERGILPRGQEYMREYQKFWTAYWEASDPVYAAVLSGDFSAFAGSYEGGSYEPEGAYNGEASITINKDGTGTGALDAESVLSVIVREGGEIYVKTDYDEGVDYERGYTIYPPGCAAHLLVRDEPSKVRISIRHGQAGAFDFLTPVS